MKNIFYKITEKIVYAICMMLDYIFPGISDDGSTQSAAMNRRQ